MTIQEKVANVKGIVNGYKASRIISAAEQLGVFAVLGKEPIDVNVISATLGVDPDRLLPILFALVGIGLVRKTDSGFDLGDYYDALNNSSPQNQLGYIRHATTMMKKWERLVDAVTNQAVKESNFNAITGEERKATKAFIQAMHANAVPQARFLCDTYNFDNQTILDIGAGAGTYSIEVGKRYINSTGILFDLPAVCEIIRENINNSDLSDRYDVMPGDYNIGLPDGKFDNVFLFAIAHQENYINLEKLLKRVYDSLSTNGRLFLSSFFLNEDRCSPEFSTMFSIEMLVMSPNGKVYTHEEINAHIEKAGFSGINRIDHIPGPSTLYIAIKR